MSREFPKKVIFSHRFGIASVVVCYLPEAGRAAKKDKHQRIPYAKQARKPETIARYGAGFVTEYAMSNESEDRAEIFFSYMAAGGPDFLKRTGKSQVLQKKWNISFG